MAWEGRLNRIDGNRWEIPMDESAGMRTNAVIYASERMIGQVCSDNAPQQAANVACLPGIVGSSMAMPDIHWGYGFPIGGVAAVDSGSGSISPGGIGFDINCGVRLIKTDLTVEDIGDRKDALIDELYKNIPSGLGSKGLTHVGTKDLETILQEGSTWAVENGYGWERDLEVTEENGRMADADPSLVSDKAMKRGLPQLGSIGSGNHFLEVDLVENISKGGNLCLNISPKADGTIPDDQQAVLRAVGAWLRTNGEAVYGSRTWTVPGEDDAAVGVALAVARLGDDHDAQAVFKRLAQHRLADARVFGFKHRPRPPS